MKKQIVAILCMVAMLFFAVPVAAQTAEELEDQLLGSVSAQYESNGDPGLISSGSGDLGGASYGAYQFASAYNTPYVFAQWCVSSGVNPEIGNALVAAYEKDKNKLGENFNAVWKQIATENKAVFLKAQRLYVKAKYYEPAVSALNVHFNIDIELYGIAFKNAVWSRTLQHGLGSYTNENGFLGILKRVSQNTPAGISSLSEESLITAIYEESGAVVETGTNPMLVANAGGNAWIIRTYGLEGKYLKYFSGNSAAVQAGVYLRLRVNEIQKLLEMLSTYGGYAGEETGRTPVYFQQEKLILSSCDDLDGFYSSQNAALSVSNTNYKEGTGALNFLAISANEELSVFLKTGCVVDYTNFSYLQFQLYLPNLPWQEESKFTVSGVVNGKAVSLFTCDLTKVAVGWQQITVPLLVELQTDTLQFTLTGIPENGVAQRFLLDDIFAFLPQGEFTRYQVLADALHCRVGPSSDFTSFGLLPKNFVVTGLGSSNGWIWCLAIDQEGNTLLGWCSGNYLQPLLTEGLLGDVNGDEKINATDALHILQYVVGKREFTNPAQLVVADATQDGKIDSLDALKVLKISVQ